MKPEVILFDFFGTLVHYEADLSRLPYPQSHELLDGWGHDLSHDGFVRLWDMATMNLERKAVESHQEFSMMDTAREFAASCPRALTDQQCHLLISTFLNEWKLHVMPVPGAADMLKRLAGSARLGVVSNTHDPTMVPEMLAAFDMAPMVDLVVLSVSHGYRKPHPSIYEFALSNLRCEVANAVFVGDSYAADFEGPQAHGITAYLIDETRRHPIPERQRLSSVLDLELRLDPYGW